VYKTLIGKHEWKGPLWKPGWEDNIKMEINKKFWEELIAYFP
jgi:hypothetical protein